MLFIFFSVGSNLALAPSIYRNSSYSIKSIRRSSHSINVHIYTWCHRHDIITFQNGVSVCVCWTYSVINLGNPHVSMWQSKTPFVYSSWASWWFCGNYWRKGSQRQHNYERNVHNNCCCRDIRWVHNTREYEYLWMRLCQHNPNPVQMLYNLKMSFIWNE